MQQHLMQMQPMMAAHPQTNVTTDIIQQYLDENKQLIIKILDDQNSGRLSECAVNQARLQHNLMYLAAIADSQPQTPVMHPQFPSNPMMQPGARYLQPHQAQQISQQSLMAARSPMLYGQQQLSALQQQAMHGQFGINTPGNGGLLMLHNEQGVGSNNNHLTTGAFPDYGRGNTGDNLQATNRGVLGSSKQETANAKSGDGTEPLYLKVSEGDGN